MSRKQNKGISLIMLIMIIIIMIILAGAIILSLSKNNPIMQATKATYIGNVKNFQSELNLYETGQFSDKLGLYDPTKLQADENSVTYDGVVDTSKTINDLIPSLGRATEYAGQFVVVDGKLVYKGSDTNRQTWSTEVGIYLITLSDIETFENGASKTIYKYTGDWSIVSNNAYEGTYCYSNKDINDNENSSSSFNISIPDDGYEYKLIFHYKTSSEQNYDFLQLYINGDFIMQDSGIKSEYEYYENDLVSGNNTVQFKYIKDYSESLGDDCAYIDNIQVVKGYLKSPILSANPSAWTNGNVAVTVSYPTILSTKEYSLDGINWSPYTTPIIVNINNTTVYARGKDSLGNVSSLATLTVTNIDKTSPTINVSKGGSTPSSVTINAITNDIDGSGINETSYQYSKDNGITWSDSTNQTSYTFDDLTEGTYQCMAKVSDNAGNTVISSTVAISTSSSTLSFDVETYENGSDNTIYSYTGDWGIITNNAYAGTHCYSNKDINDNQTSSSNFNLYIPNDGCEYKLTFYYKTSSEQNYDYLKLYINGNFTMQDSGVKSTYAYYEKVLSPGNNTIQFSYTKDSSVSSGNDCAYIDNIQLVKGNLAPPTITASPTIWTNDSVIATITYPNILTEKEYSLDGINWSTYSNPIVVNNNNTTVYARGYDAHGNESGNTTLTVANIDRDLPTVTFGTNGGTVSSASTTVSVSDLGGSSINSSTLQYIWDTQNTTTPSSGWTVFTNGSNLTMTEDGAYYLWIKGSDNAGNTVILVSNKFIVGEQTTVVSTVKTYNSTFDGSTTGYSYNNPVIPAGFVAINTNDSSWNNLSTDWDKGLVIKDTSGNQFVWVPVDGINVPYAKWCTFWVSYTKTIDDTNPLGFDESNITTKYKGFYIGRYEAMFDYNNGTTRMASKKSKNKTENLWTRDNSHSGYIFNYVNYAESKTYCESMATDYGYDTTLVGTNLITGTEWDTIARWINNSGLNAGDIRSYGNCENSVFPANISGYGNLQISGYSNYWKVKNIYDFAGNTCEWTSELYSSNPNFCMFRGGSFWDNGDTVFPLTRRTDFEVSSSMSISFRVALFIK